MNFNNVFVVNSGRFKDLVILKEADYIKSYLGPTESFENFMMIESSGYYGHSLRRPLIYDYLLYYSYERSQLEQIYKRLFNPVYLPVLYVGELFRERDFLFIKAYYKDRVINYSFYSLLSNNFSLDFKKRIFTQYKPIFRSYFNKNYGLPNASTYAYDIANNTASNTANNIKFKLQKKGDKSEAL